MSLADRLAAPKPLNQCGTCTWYKTLTTKERNNFDKWIISGASITELWAVCSARIDDNGTPAPNPLPVKLSAFKSCIKRDIRPQIAGTAA